MSKTLFFGVLAILVLAIPALAQDATDDFFSRNPYGDMSTLRTYPTADGFFTFPNARATLDSTWAVSYTPTLSRGVSFRLIWHAGSAGTADTVWLFTNPTNPRAAGSDSVGFPVPPGEIAEIPISVAEDDSIRVDINSSGGSIFGRLDANDRT